MAIGSDELFETRKNTGTDTDTSTGTRTNMTAPTNQVQRQKFCICRRLTLKIGNVPTRCKRSPLITSTGGERTKSDINKTVGE